MERPLSVVPDHAYRAHRAPDLPVPVDEPITEPHPANPDHPHVPEEEDDPVPDHKPELH
jgi:hypothetical protein